MFGVCSSNALHARPLLNFRQTITPPCGSAEGNGRGLVTHDPHDFLEHTSLYTFSKFGGRSSHAVRVVIFFVVHDGCLCVLVVFVSPSLSHSSQLKARVQMMMEYCERVSDECSSGVMRAWHVAQSIPSVCSMCAVYC